MSEDSKTIVTPTGRITFEKNVFKVNNKDRRTVCLLFKDNQNLKAMQEIMMEAAKAKFDEKIYNSKKFSWPLKQADEDSINNYDFMDEETMVLNASTKFEIEVKGTNKGPDNKYEDLIEGDFKAGDYFRAVISAWAWEYEDQGKKRGVSFNVMALQKIKDGEAFYSRKPSDDIFGEVEFDVEVEESEASGESEVEAGGNW